MQKGLRSFQVAENREKFGSNTLPAPDKVPWYRQLAAKFNDPIIKILIVAALLSGLTGGSIEAIGILIALLLAVGIGFVNEYRAGREFDILNRIADSYPVKVYRDGLLATVPREELVVGDLIRIERGEEIPADARVQESCDCRVDQSKFTGESISVAKAAGMESPADDPYPADFLISGTTVLEGWAEAVVTAVGAASEWGKTAHAAAIDTGALTPLQRQLADLSKVIARVGGFLALALFVILCCVAFRRGELQWGDWAGLLQREHLHLLLGFFMAAVTLIVVAVPEGLVMSITLALAYGMRRMAAENNLVRKLNATETVGAVSTICTDKTGTLTCNEMRLRQAAMPDSDLALDALCVNSTAELECKEKLFSVIGNPTEGALLLHLEAHNIDYRSRRAAFPVARQWPFDSDRKWMATLGTNGILHVKGAPDILLTHCDLAPEEREKVDAFLKAEQKAGARTLAFAYAENRTADQTPEELTAKLQLIGVVSIADPPRADVPAAIHACREAGIHVKVVTGDTATTAIEIGREIGLFKGETPEEATISGKDFAALSEEEAARRVGKLAMIYRARPEDKLRLVRLLQAQNEVVAVTGDGTNDAPALNHADVGIAMGRTGTAVAREASDIILLDDSFSSIVHAVLWGRSLYCNIQKFLLFQLTINVAAVAMVLIGPFLGVELPLTVIQMLWVNLIMDTFAALALATEPPNEELLKRPPRPRGEFIVTPSMAFRLFGTAAIFAGLGAWAIKTGGNDEKSLTMIFTGFVFLQFWNLFNAKCFGSDRSIFSHILNNRCFLAVAALIPVGQILIVQFGGKVFRTVPLSAMDYVKLIAGTSLVLVAGELLRLFQRHYPNFWHKLYLKMVKERGTPEYIARGWTLGVVIGWMLPIGLQLIVAIPLAFVIKGSKIGAAIGTCITNPVTAIVIYPMQCWIGNKIMGGSLSYQFLADSLEELIHRPSHQALLHLSREILISYLLGGAVLTLLTAPVAYYMVKHMVIHFRALLAHRRQARKKSENA